MSHLLDDDDDLGAQRDRELTLSTGAILGLFFGLVVLCGVVFAFGYSMGRHKTSPADNTTATEAATDSPSTNFTTFKPAAGSPAGSGPATVTAPPASAAASPQAPVQSHVVQVQPSYSPSNSTPAYAPPSAPPAPIVRTPPPSAQPVPEPTNTATTPGTPGFFMVQVAAVSHKEDADLLLSALRGRGYTVMARTYSADPLIHIQVGPFNNRKDAEAMRSKLLGDGYNAIVK